MSKKFIAHLIWVVWLTLIYILCLTPGNQLPKIELELISISTVAHFTFYFVLAYLLLSAFSGNKEKKLNLSNIKLYAIVVISCLIIGLSIEWLQEKFIFQRYYELIDVMINLIGTIFGAITYSLKGKKIV